MLPPDSMFAKRKLVTDLKIVNMIIHLFVLNIMPPNNMRLTLVEIVEDIYKVLCTGLRLHI